MNSAGLDPLLFHLPRALSSPLPPYLFIFFWPYHLSIWSLSDRCLFSHLGLEVWWSLSILGRRRYSSCILDIRLNDEKKYPCVSPFSSSYTLLPSGLLFKPTTPPLIPSAQPLQSALLAKGFLCNGFIKVKNQANEFDQFCIMPVAPIHRSSLAMYDYSHHNSRSQQLIQYISPLLFPIPLLLSSPPRTSSYPPHSHPSVVIPPRPWIFYFPSPYDQKFYIAATSSIFGHRSQIITAPKLALYYVTYFSFHSYNIPTYYPSPLPPV